MGAGVVRSAEDPPGLWGAWMGRPSAFSKTKGREFDLSSSEAERPNGIMHLATDEG